MLKKLFRILSRRPKRMLDKSNDNESSELKNNDEVKRILSVIDIKSDILVTVVGIQHYFGSKPFEIGGTVHFIKEPGNKHDSNAIMAICDGFGKCGYIANNKMTIKEGTISADILNNGIKDIVKGEVLMVEEYFAVCSLNDTSIFEMLLMHCKHLMHKNDFRSALAVLYEMELRWNSPEIMLKIVECNYKLDNYSVAASKAEKMLKSYPNDENIKQIMNDIQVKMTNKSFLS